MRHLLRSLRDVNVVRNPYNDTCEMGFFVTSWNPCDTFRFTALLITRYCPILLVSLPYNFPSWVKYCFFITGDFTTTHFSGSSIFLVNGATSISWAMGFRDTNFSLTGSFYRLLLRYSTVWKAINYLIMGLVSSICYHTHGDLKTSNFPRNGSSRSFDIATFRSPRGL